MNLAEDIRAQAVAMLQQATVSHDELNQVLRLFAKYRSVLIANTVLELCGRRVQTGPFAGMEYRQQSTEGCHVPKLLGCYEREIQAFVEAAVATDYDQFVNIGSSEGYYAVGMARCCPRLRVHAYDINPAAQQACREMAGRNGVADRVVVSGSFTPADFPGFRGPHTLFLIDIEGNEADLFRDLSGSQLKDFDLIIECHDCLRPGTSHQLTRSLTGHHVLCLVKQGMHREELPPMFDRLTHLDRLLAVWEWRSGPTPWLLAASHARPDSAFFRAVSQRSRSS